MRVLVCGDRNWIDVRTIHEHVDQLPADTVLLEGGERGAELIAKQRAERRGIKVLTMPAEWDVFGMGAAAIRNRVMFESGIQSVLVFHDYVAHARNEADVISRARYYKVPFVVVRSRELRRRKIMATKNNKTVKANKASAKKASAAKSGGREWNQTYAFAKEAKIPPSDDTIMGCVYRAIKKVKSGNATAITEQALAYGLADHSGQDPRVQTQVMLRRLIADKVVTVTRSTGGAEGKAKASPAKKATAGKANGSLKVAKGKSAKKAGKKSLKVKLRGSSSGSADDAVL